MVFRKLKLKESAIGITSRTTHLLSVVMLLETGYERKDICGSHITTIINEQAFITLFFEGPVSVIFACRQTGNH